MREIKFRAWDKQFKKWVNPKIVCKWAIYSLENQSSITHEITQFTGLKDKNDKEIYEGDIVQYDSTAPLSYTRPQVVIWSDLHAGFVVEAKGVGRTSCIGAYKWEIIGNVFENPNYYNKSASMAQS